MAPPTGSTLEKNPAAKPLRIATDRPVLAVKPWPVKDLAALPRLSDLLVESVRCVPLRVTSRLAQYRRGNPLDALPCGPLSRRFCQAVRTLVRMSLCRLTSDQSNLLVELDW
ncbi:MAG: hypothetical protein J0I20_31575 [Chloroflexi bacterium]|nr:hypothetical protein [Chloroflexota bacterium]